jgi:hypothetical protein
MANTEREQDPSRIGERGNAGGRVGGGGCGGAAAYRDRAEAAKLVFLRSPAETPPPHSDEQDEDDQGQGQGGHEEEDDDGDDDARVSGRTHDRGQVQAALERHVEAVLKAVSGGGGGGGGRTVASAARCARSRAFDARFPPTATSTRSHSRKSAANDIVGSADIDARAETAAGAGLAADARGDSHLFYAAAGRVRVALLSRLLNALRSVLRTTSPEPASSCRPSAPEQVPAAAQECLLPLFATAFACVLHDGKHIPSFLSR